MAELIDLKSRYPLGYAIAKRFTPDIFAFELWQSWVAKWEGENIYTNDPNDPGGPTKQGITINTWSRYAPLAGYRGDLYSLQNASPTQLLRVAELLWTDVTGDYPNRSIVHKVVDAEISWASGVDPQTILDQTGVTIKFEDMDPRELFQFHEKWLRAIRPDLVNLYGAGWGARWNWSNRSATETRPGVYQLLDSLQACLDYLKNIWSS